jgi:hypothetical protein
MLFGRLKMGGESSLNIPKVKGCEIGVKFFFLSLFAI